MIRRGPGTETEKALFPFIFLRNGTSIKTSRERNQLVLLAFFEEVGAAVYVCASHKTVLSTRRHPPQPVSALILRPRDTSSVATKLGHRQQRCRQQQ